MSLTMNASGLPIESEWRLLMFLAMREIFTASGQKPKRGSKSESKIIHYFSIYPGGWEMWWMDFLSQVKGKAHLASAYQCLRKTVKIRFISHFPNVRRRVNARKAEVWRRAFPNASQSSALVLYWSRLSTEKLLCELVKFLKYFEQLMSQLVLILICWPSWVIDY